MNEQLREIPDRILGLAIAALTQANTHAVFMDPGNEHWPLMSVLNAAHAGELFLKAIIAREHPLLLFKDVVSLDDNRSDELDIQSLLTRGRTHEFERLPQVLWATTGTRIPDLECYERLRRARNAIQHFCPPDDSDLSQLSLEFIYTIIDPLIVRHFGLYAIEHHEDHSVSYDYVVACLLRREIRFSVPDDFAVTEIEAAEEIADATVAYRLWLRGELERIGRTALLDS
ncbi:hypothetical protein E0H35_21725 [Rhizobium leguminosarum bv. viciae]|uniref:hypothetical protein n=1 Tax=Rhizobium leguminosarum TaxID=384 RepID=UPI001031BA14|nr:hypothetical protein [Rhizobium leguminosarum]MBY5339605.1 hypothetical protein [Rhizobium leguminosarum]NKK48505.1 hypothetical protein [Rhizobium leguminosarum bv. viciae]TBG85363.1 hypothetical protein ELG69_15275 [Rhizobium leguminosarum]TBY95728.1 hypothetical protein E0H35_21725 [Rhizobium leguminosarum bv. viciae]